MKDASMSIDLMEVMHGAQVGAGVCPACSDLHLGIVLPDADDVTHLRPLGGRAVQIHIRMKRADALELANRILLSAGSIA